ncbi:fumarylacetoacetate hydrolase family protein [Variovorax guangxiensis]|uniref:fumarylacetoacetate hydrolase family protein n=1 Tax=Variovorax guangxiensis TaxID=1775474 RepID=UPI0028577C1C|nr:fumarylacetoacetate hydrolase family protein [Variovorax guangxiensis]MDR6860757.1 fumarylacetoacetate (FAA) hydrolase family protein [Variovorax guangxiensis]
MSIPLALRAERCLPDDGYTGILVGRVWRPELAGPSVVAIREGGIHDLSAEFPTMSSLLDLPEPARAVREAAGERIASLDELLANGDEATRDAARPFLLAPCDLQVVKAAGVTFASSMLERVIEEQAGGDAQRAESVRARVVAQIGTDLSAVKPGSPQATALKQVLQEQGLWSQYLEVGIGPDAEVFSKAPVLSAVGTGADIGVRSDSSWNNPEPEVVLAVDSRGRIVGATLGNDVNLRDLEGRSALLLSKAKDNNASCAIGPFIRLFDRSFDLADVRKEVVNLRVDGPEGFALDGINSMQFISREPQDLVDQAIAAHQYPDGFMLFLGTLFAPTQDRDHPGGGFTHKVGDRVSIRSARLGELCNRVRHCEDIAPWTFGLRALIANLSGRGLLATGRL